MTIAMEQRSSPRPTKPIDRVADLLARHSIDVLRVCLGLVFVGFAIPKFFPGLSPAEPLVTKAVDMLTLGVLHGQAAMVVTALVECFVGLTLVFGTFLRIGLLVFGLAVLGFLSPLVLFPGDLFAGGPTLEAQYILKDIVLFAAGMVVAAKTPGARLERE